MGGNGAVRAVPHREGAPRASGQIAADAGQVAWDIDRWAFLEGDADGRRSGPPGRVRGIVRTTR